jgi:hypothetical protein
MNCKPGDLALVVKGFPENLGKMVQCVRIITDSTELIPTSIGALSVQMRANTPIWLLDRRLRCMTTKGVANLCAICADAYLMPIRPEPQDEKHEADVAHEFSTVEEYLAKRPAIRRAVARLTCLRRR